LDLILDSSVQPVSSALGRQTCICINELGTYHKSGV